MNTLEVQAKNYIDRLKSNDLYRDFISVDKNCEKGIYAEILVENEIRNVLIWCSNDYLGMSKNEEVISSMKSSLEKYGAGSGGSRNIGGTNTLCLQLELCIAAWYRKDASLCFPTGFSANEHSIQAISKLHPNTVYFSDSLNHASLINGILSTGCKKEIFNHNDTEHLDELLSKYDNNFNKIIVFESLYSMDGDFSPISDIVNIARKHNAITFLDEVHAVGIYGEDGAGLASMFNVLSDIDIIQGTMAKSIGLIGGFIAGNSSIIDAIRSLSRGFIFTTSLPPSIIQGCLTSISIIKRDSSRRNKLMENTENLKKSLDQRKIQYLNNNGSHIIPIIIGNSKNCKKISSYLLTQKNIYIPPIFFPTVPEGTARLRVCASPFHSADNIEYLCDSIKSAFSHIQS